MYESMYQKTTLDNGLRIITSTMPMTRSISVVFFIGTGSRYESAESAGVSHFVEHLLFKGTHKRPTAKDISEAIEGVGGVLNGGTDRELTIYWAKVASTHFDLAFDVLVDMLMNSKYDAEEVEKERKVIIEELNMILDAPHERVDVLIDEVLWPDQPLGRDVAGTKETVNSFTRQDALDYVATHYAPTNTVISIVGNVEHEAVVEKVQRALGGWQAESRVTLIPAQNGQNAPRWRIENRKTEQAHLCLGVRGLSNSHPDRYALDLLNVVLGEGMSSRLFLEIREKRGLAYQVHSYISHFLDSGSAVIYAGVEPKHTERTISAILEELNHLKEGIPEAELTKVKEFSKGRMLLRMEDTRSVASWLGGQELLTGQIRTVDEVVEIIDSITAEDLQRVAKNLFVTEKLNLALVGPFRAEKRLAGILKF